MMAVMSSIRRAPHKPEAFTAQQRDVLFDTLRRIISDEEARTGERVTGSKIGEWLGIKQQSVSRFLAGRGAGIQYGTASALARKAGFRSLDALFEAYGVLPGQEPGVRPAGAGTGDPAIDAVIELARIQGVEDSVIAHTLEENRNEQQPDDFGRRQRWWMKRFLSAQELVDKARQDPTSAPSSPRLKTSN